MAGWGLGYDDLRRIRPDLVMLSSSIFGQFGPHALMPGVGTMGAARAGFSRMTGHPGRLETGPNGPYTDFVAPRLAVAAVLAALDHRARTGEGNHLDLSQLEASLCFIAPELYRAAMSGEDPAVLGNRDPEMVPHGVYPTKGDDTWVAIACRDDRDWRTLCHVIGEGWLQADPDLASVDDRRRREDEIDDRIARWTRARSAADVEGLLVAAGVPAAALLDHGDWWKDPQLVHRSHLVSGTHPLHGTVLVESTHLGLQGTPGAVDRGGPTIGQHSELVLRSILGYDDERIEQLRASGAVGHADPAGS
jgi:crotonobetainyl-CoA:carnitine CoA-transferase CaiB-like acyl-CoA transferase